MPQIKASSSERGPCVFFLMFFFSFLTHQQWHSENGGSWLWYYIMYSWLSGQKWVWSTRRVWKVEREEMQGTMVEAEGGWKRVVVDVLSMKVSRKTFIHTPIWEKKNRWKECTDTPHDKIALHSQTRGMHTSSAEYTTFITFELINRKSGGKATRITVFRKLRKEEKQKNKKAAQSNDESTCQEKEKRVNKVQWRLLTEGPDFFFFLDHKIIHWARLFNLTFLLLSNSWPHASLLFLSRPYHPHTLCPTCAKTK